jgi:Fe-S-cluster containining protein
MPEIRASLPIIYRDLLADPLAEHVVEETKATCASCAMLEGGCQGTAAPPVDGRSRFFRPDTKCCTFHPRLPNYLLGGILTDEDPGATEGRRRLQARIASRVGVTPAWLHPPRTFSLLYDNSRGAFGRAGSLRCPFYETAAGGCTIWAHRDAVCSTYFCKYVAGEDGRRFWTAVKELVSLVEIQLARAALLELAPELLDREPLTRPASAPIGPEDVDGAGPPEEQYAAAWGGWAGREVELYVACHAYVRSLRAEDLDALLGLDGRIARRSVRRALDAARSTSLPEVLRLDPNATVAWLRDGSVALGAYSELEAVALPGAAYPLLTKFTGEDPVSAVRSRLRAEEHADLSDEVLLELYRQRVLAAPPARSVAKGAAPKAR